VSLNKRDEVSTAFVDVVDRVNKLSSVQISGAAETENEQGDYGYGEFSGGDGSNCRANSCIHAVQHSTAVLCGSRAFR